MKNKLLPLFFILASYSAYSQVGIGTTMPNPSSQLEVVANDKGVLIPRIQLKNVTDASTIANGNVNSLLVFNTATAADIKPGYYYWYDNKWNRIVIAGEVESNKGTVIYNAVTKEFVFVDDSGANQPLDFGSSVKKHETITTLTNNNDGTYTYLNETGENPVTINVVGDVASNFETIINNPAVTNVLNTFVTKSEGTVSFNSTTNEFTYTDASGVTKTVNINEIVKGNETITTLTNNNNGTYTYANEAGDNVTINVVGDVASNFETIINNPAVTNVLNNFVTKSEGTVSFNSTTNEFTYTDASGVTKTVNINEIVKGNETITTLVKNAANDGKYVYKNEDNAETTIDVVADVINNSSTILSDPKFVTELTQFVDAKETVTILTNNNNGTYTYANEAGDNVTINVVGDVVTNFSDIINNPAVTNVLNTFVTKSEGTVSFNSTTNEFTYTDASGVTQTVNISEIVKGNETLTSLAYDATGKTLTYQPESGAATVIKLVDMVGDAETLTTLDKSAANDGKYVYKSENDTQTTIDVVADVINNSSTILSDPKFVTELTQFVDAKETVTTITNNNNGSYTYANEAGDNVTINVVGDVASNFETIINNPAVTNVLNNFVTKSEGTVSFNSTTNEFTYTDASGVTQTVNISEIVKGNETLTSLAYDATGKTLTYQPESGAATVIKLVDMVGDAETLTTLDKNAANDGKYVYKSENDTQTTIDVVADVINNSSTILSDPKFVTELTQFVDAKETVTTITNNNNGSYTYANEAGDNVTINVVGDVATNFETIINNPAVTNVLNNFVTKSEGTVSFNSTTNEFTYTDVSGVTQTVNISEIVKGNETLTSLAYDATGKTLTYQPESGAATVIKLVDMVGDAETLTTLDKNAANDGKYVYKSENDTQTTIDVVADVINNSSTILSDPKFVTELTQFVDAKETVTTITNNNNGSYTYANEAGDNVTINVVGDVATNFETIINNPAVTNVLNNFVTKSEGTVSFNSTTNEFTYTDASGVTQTVNISEIVKGNETLTSLAYDATGKTLTYQPESGAATVIKLVDMVGDAETLTTLDKNAANDGKYVYKSENDTQTTIDVVADVINNASTIINDSKFANELTQFVGSNETLTSLAYDATGKTLTYQPESGAATVIKLVDMVGDAETLTTLDKNAANDGKYVYKSENDTQTTIDVVADVINNASTIINDSKFANELTQFVGSNETLTSLAYDATGKTLTYQPESGAATVIKLVDMVGDAETLTTLDKNAANDGKYVYKSENDTQTTIDVVADVINNASTIINDSKFANELTQFVGSNETLTSLAYDATGKTLTYQPESGAATVIKLVDMVGDAETLTTLDKNAANDGKYVYKSENDTQTTIDVVADVINNASTIINDSKFANELTQFVGSNETLTSLAYDATGKTLTYQPESGAATVIKLVDMVGDAQTLTSLAVNGTTGTLDYKDENNFVTPINLSAAVKEPWFSSTTKAGATTNTENIYTQGWVGIGFDTPSGKAGEKLRINGSITTVNSTYADYVFEDYFQGYSDIKADYKFKGLAEIEQYIKTHKHLPGITPINELERTSEGYSFNMSELSIQLLEKTEEIYLHIIEQNNAIIAKDKEIAKMNERLDRLEKLIEENTTSSNQAPVSSN